MHSERLGHILLRQGLIASQELDFCLNIQRNNGGERLGRVLRHYDFIGEDDIARALAQQVGWQAYEGAYCPADDMFALLGTDFLTERLVFPAREDEDVVFVVARTDDMATTDHIQARLASPACFRLAPEGRIRRALERVRAKPKTEHAAGPVKDNDLSGALDGYLNTALAKGASDIHIEASQKAAEVRVRTDGMLHFLDSLRLDQLPRLVNIIFHRAQVTVSDFGHVHDARFSHEYMERAVDVRVSHIPSVHGSSVVLRLLDKNKTSMGLTELGYGRRQWDFIQENLAKPEGITLLVGPTGCGKTTTLYAMLNFLKSMSRKIVTVEDPVEIYLPLMMQVQTNEKREIGFGDAVRAFLRHDPNIIFIGEVRDQETAREAVRAAMTGHKVFSTVHANRPVDAILRLNDLGVPYTHMAGNLNLIITQRLMRRLCNLCKVKKRVTKAQQQRSAQKYLESEQQTVFHPQGCLYCREGFKGLAVVSEVLMINQSMEILIGKGQIMELQRHLQEDKTHITMFDDARRLIKEGLVSIDEAVRVLG